MVIERNIKYRIIFEFSTKHSVCVMCRFLSVSRSAYYSWLKRRRMKDKDGPLIEAIRTGQDINKNTYGYRRMTLWLNNFIGIHVNNKRVRRVMKKAGLQAEIRKKKKFKVMSGNIHSYENILNREFRSDRPNQKLVTDITYIRTKKGNIFLSMIKDLFDNSIQGYQISRNNNIKLVTDTLKKAFENNNKVVADGPILHSDQGFQYTSHAYFNLTQRYGLKVSMSRKGNCLDNACAENFFSHIKSELVNRVKWENYEEAKDAIDEYIRYYNNDRIQIKLKKAPMQYRSLFIE